MTTSSQHALTRATQQRTASAEQSVVNALAVARAAGGRVTIAGIAAAAGVSTDFIYRHPILRAQVEQLRQTTRASVRAADTESDQVVAASPLVRRLTQQITRERKEHRTELGRLRSALESAHGELLRLRRELQ